MPDVATSDLEASLMVCSLTRSHPHPRRRDRQSVVATGSVSGVGDVRVVSWQRARTTNPACHSRYSMTISCRAKRVRFFRNGDQYFQGVLYALSRDRCRTFEGLLEDLNRTLGDLVSLPHGVRFVFSLDAGGARVSSLDDFVDGHSYVCSSTDVLKRIDYENARQPLWSYGRSRCEPESDTQSLICSSSLGHSDISEPNDFVHPKIITLIRSGLKPRKIMRFLLNKRTARSFEQILTDFATLVKLDSGVVKKIFALSGRPITSLLDFFSDEKIFLVCGSEKITVDDFCLDNEEHKFLQSSRYGGEHALRNASASKYNHHRKSVAYPLKRLDAKETQSCSSVRFSMDPSWHMLVDSGDQHRCHRFGGTAELPHELMEVYRIGRVIGDGNFAVVHECFCKQTSQRYAAKIIDKRKSCLKEEVIQNEIRLMQDLRHPNIVQLYSNLDTQDFICLILEHVEGGDLFDSLVRAKRYSEKVASHLTQNLVSALEYLHDKKIVHRDVKPENLLVYRTSDGRMQLKVADFGLATKADGLLYTVCGTPTYVAPEILSEVGYGLKVDIWAAGVILYMMLSGFPPFYSSNGKQEELFQIILSGQYGFPRPYWDDVSSAAKSLIQGMLQFDDADRYSAREVLIHPWIMGESQVNADFEEFSALALKDSDVVDSDSERVRGYFCTLPVTDATLLQFY